ncbi:hypothetical protein [Mycoplasma sp. Ms02]|uniref:hypothetical protein n=1 Tax=Mycoplasma sp. Ms02 TaxID=353851 RepID=UPI001C8A41BB|nr:hypothetical protein [Mycoplasma sp. Ms02]QZE12593.1 hypothetical protein K4L35_01235 [Mycoplasma sp. Ms02]
MINSIQLIKQIEKKYNIEHEYWTKQEITYGQPSISGIELKVSVIKNYKNDNFELIIAPDIDTSKYKQSFLLQKIQLKISINDKTIITKSLSELNSDIWIESSVINLQHSKLSSLKIEIIQDSDNYLSTTFFKKKIKREFENIKIKKGIEELKFQSGISFHLDKSKHSFSSRPIFTSVFLNINLINSTTHHFNKHPIYILNIGALHTLEINNNSKSPYYGFVGKPRVFKSDLTLTFNHTNSLSMPIKVLEVNENQFKGLVEVKPKSNDIFKKYFNLKGKNLYIAKNFNKELTYEIEIQIEDVNLVFEKSIVFDNRTKVQKSRIKITDHPYTQLKTQNSFLIKNINWQKILKLKNITMDAFIPFRRKKNED